MQNTVIKKALLGVVLLAVALVMHVQYFSWMPPEPNEKWSHDPKGYAEIHQTKSGIPPYRLNLMPEDQAEARVFGLFIPLALLAYVIYSFGVMLIDRRTG